MVSGLVRGSCSRLPDDKRSLGLIGIAIELASRCGARGPQDLRAS
jgi:hypothetical protein